MSDFPLRISSPVHPLDAHLPRSDIRLELSEGNVIEILNFPLQGLRTIENLQVTLELWKPNLVKPELEYQI